MARSAAAALRCAAALWPRGGAQRLPACTTTADGAAAATMALLPWWSHAQCQQQQQWQRCRQQQCHRHQGATPLLPWAAALQRHAAWQGVARPPEAWPERSAACPQQLQAWRCFHSPVQQEPRPKQPAPRSPQPQPQPQPPGRAPGASLTSLPNLLSLSRVAAGPWLAFLIATQQWPLAFTLTAVAGATDWADGYLARRLGHTSKLGSYLDPLADKVFIATAVGTMGLLGMVPAWLAALVVGRDSAQVAGMFWIRLRMFGGRWPGAAAFFDVDGTAGAAAGAPIPAAAVEQQPPLRGAAADDGNSSAAGGAAAQHPSGGGLPAVRPLLVSKANTALVLLLVGGCMAHQWQGVPPQELLDALELAAAGTTAASALAYARLHQQGRLLAAPAPARR